MPPVNQATWREVMGFREGDLVRENLQIDEL